MIYALVTYHWRAQAIRNRGSGPYDDRLGMCPILTQAPPSFPCCSLRRSSSTLCCASASSAHLCLHSLLCDRIGMNRYALRADLVYRPMLCIHLCLFHGLERAAQLGAINHLAKDRVLAVKVRLLAVGDKKLYQSHSSAPASDWCSGRLSPWLPCPAHGTAVSRMPHLERWPDLIVKGASPNGLAPFARASRVARLL